MTKRELIAAGAGATLVAIFWITSALIQRLSQAPRRPDSASRSETPAEPTRSGPRTATDPALEANAELTRQVSELNRQVRALEADKRQLEQRAKELESAQIALDAAVAVTKHEFDLSRADWVRLAREGTVKSSMPVPGHWPPDADFRSALGISRGDMPAVEAAYRGSLDRMWAVLAPLCPELSDGGGPSVNLVGKCGHRIVQMARETDRAAMENAMLDVAEVRAGLRASPSEPDHPVALLLLMLTAEPELLIGDLAKNFGPDTARRIVFRERGCGWTSTWGRMKRHDR